MVDPQHARLSITRAVPPGRRSRGTAFYYASRGDSSLPNLRLMRRIDEQFRLGCTS